MDERIVPVPQGRRLRTLRRLLRRRETDEQRERRQRLELALAAAELMPYLSVKLPGGEFVTTAPDASSLLAKGSRAEFVVLRRAVELVEQAGAPVEGRVFLDVGANVGTATVTAVAVHGFGRAVAVEPDPANVRLLKANAALNGVDDRVTVVSAAAAAAAGPRWFARGRDADGGWSTGTGRLAGAGIRVRGRTLDEVARSCALAAADVGLLWLDVQGHEVEALEGAASLLAARPPLAVAMRPLELAREDDLERLRALLDPGYTRFVDLRRPTLRARWRPEERPLAALAALEGDPISTDLLVLP